jgi:hypothetical protein
MRHHSPTRVASGIWSYTFFFLGCRCSKFNHARGTPLSTSLATLFLVATQTHTNSSMKIVQSARFILIRLAFKLGMGFLDELFFLVFF